MHISAIMERGIRGYEENEDEVIIKMTFSLILSMIMAVMMNITAMAVVIDVSSHDGLID